MWSLKAIIKVSPLLMSLFVPPAYAENWAAIGVSAASNQTLYVDKDSIEKVGGFASFWIKIGIEKSLLSFNTYTDSIDQVVLNCEERTFAVTKSFGVRGNGERVSIKEVDPASWSFKKVVDASPISNHWSQFCSEKVASVQPSQSTVAPLNTPPATPNSPDFSTGSGFFVTPDGYFVTNYHVIAGAETIALFDVNSKMHMARVVRIDKANDIAVLKAEGKFKAIPIVTSRTAKRGQSVITVGYPHANIQGLEPKVTGGIINSLTGLNNDARTFQISVPLQSGNSGGPLVTMEGNIIGVVAMKLSALAVFKETGDLPQNVNYAIKSNYLLEVLLGIPGLERKLLAQSKKPYRNVAELTTAIEGATALVLAAVKENRAAKGVENSPRPEVTRTRPIPSTEVEVLNAIREGLYRNDGGFIRAPDVAENGAVVPAEISLTRPLSNNECVYLFVDDRFLSHKACAKGKIQLTLLSVRVKIPTTGNLTAAIVGSEGDIRSFAKAIRITIGARPDHHSKIKSGLDARIKSYAEGSQGVIKMLINSPMTTNDYLMKATFLFGREDSLEVKTTPWASANPYIGVTVIPPPGVYNFTSELLTNLGEAGSMHGTF